MATQVLQTDKATEAYWSGVWRSAAAADNATISATRQDRYNFYDRHLCGMQGKSLIEVGCANSAALPYLAKTHGLCVSGLDYSDVGCVAARDVLHAAGVQGDIHWADLFSPPDSMLGKFDVVLSGGLIEHFADTAGVVRAMARLGKPGALMITTLPNLAGLLGSAQKRLDRDVYDVHVPLTREAVIEAHDQAGTRVIECRYATFADFHLLSAKAGIKTFALKCLQRASQAARRLERRTNRPLLVNRLTATAILCAAEIGGGPAKRLNSAASAWVRWWEQTTPPEERTYD
jgi:SAM-dependent methyltransferase